jgi:hypothetical protein
MPSNRRRPPIIKAGAIRGLSHAMHRLIKRCYGHLTILAATAALAVP